MVGHDQSDHLSKYVAKVTDFWCASTKSAYPTFIVCTGIPQRMGESQYGMDARVNNSDDPSVRLLEIS